MHCRNRSVPTEGTLLLDWFAGPVAVPYRSRGNDLDPSLRRLMFLIHPTGRSSTFPTCSASH